MPLGALTPRDQLDRLLALGRRALRYAWVAALVTILGAVISVALALTRPRVYQSQTVIMHREVIPQNLVQGGESAMSLRGMGIRFREMVLASPLLEKVIDKFQLCEEGCDSSEISNALEELRQQISFSTSGHGTFAIRYRGGTPKQAQQVAAYLAELLIEWETKIQLESVSVTKNFLEEERARAEAELRQREKALAEFLADHPEFAQETSNPAGGTAAGASIRAQRGRASSSSSSSSSRLRALQRQRDRIRARLETAPTPAPAPRHTPSPEVERTRRELHQAQRDLEDKQARFTELHPDVVAARRRVARAQERLEEAEKVAGVPVTAPASTPEEREALRAELEKLDQEIAAQRRRERSGDEDSEKSDTADEVVELETEWARLNREVEDMRDRYEGIEAKAYTAEIVAASESARQGSQLTIIEPASLPTRPSGAPRTLVVIAGTFVFGCMGVLIALGFALVDDRITGRYDIERLEIVPVLVEVPKSSEKRSA